MKRFFAIYRAWTSCLLLALMVSVLAPSVLAQDDFISSIDDLPLMPGLVEEEGGMVFDSPSGRIVEAFATGNVSPGEVLSFYNETLPQLGWRSLGGHVFRRESEILKLEFPGGPGAAPPLTVGFSLSPALK
jgi:hypothetical protein